MIHGFREGDRVGCFVFAERAPDGADIAARATLGSTGAGGDVELASTADASTARG